jgi:thioredoxin reductase
VSNQIKNKVIIIGGGSSGLYMAKLLEENHISYIIIESFYQVGGQCKNIYPNKYMYDIPGLGKISGEEFTNILLSFINQKNINYNEKYINYKCKDNDTIEVTTSKNIYLCEYLIFSYGMGECIFNKPIIENLEIYENKQIFYFPSNPSNIKNKNILIFGGGDTALDAAEALYQNNNVTLVHRRDIFKNYEGKNYLLNKIQTYIPYSLYKLNGDNNSILNSVLIKNHNDILDLKADYVYFCYGYNQEYLPEKFNVDKSNMEVEINKNIFAIGGIANYSTKRNLITNNMYECRIVLMEIMKNKFINK